MVHLLTSWRSILILSFHLHLGFQVASFPQVSPPKPCTHLSSPIQATCPAHLIRLDLVTFHAMSKSRINGAMHSLPHTSFRHVALLRINTYKFKSCHINNVWLVINIFSAPMPRNAHQLQVSFYWPTLLYKLFSLVPHISDALIWETVVPSLNRLCFRPVNYARSSVNKLKVSYFYKNRIQFYLHYKHVTHYNQPE